MKIIDCFLFYNEFDMLDARLEYLYDVVDHFVIVEATKTYVGTPKPLFFQDNTERYKCYLDKIVHIIVDDMPTSNNPWDLEKHQRNAISQFVDRISAEASDLVIISDCDEIINKNTLLEIKNNSISTAHCLNQTLYCYNLKTKATTQWLHAKILPYSEFINRKPDDIRMDFNCPVIDNAGWHLSYFGSIEFIQNKIYNFSHQEFNTIQYTSYSNIETAINSATSIFNRQNSDLVLIPEIETSLPQIIINKFK